MDREKLYDAAFRYKKAGLWKKLWDTEIFAIKLPGDENGFVSVMGKGGDYNAIGLYIGEEGFQSFRTVANDFHDYASEFEAHEAILVQNCLQMNLGNKDEMLPEEAEQVRAYAKAHGIRLSGANAFPDLVKFTPYYHPWGITEQKDADMLCHALEVAILLAEELKNVGKAELGIREITPFTEEVPLFDIGDGKLEKLGMTQLPGDKPARFNVSFSNQIAVQRVKKMRKKGIWECELVRLPKPSQNEPDAVPYYPLFLFVVDRETHFLMPTTLIDNFENKPQNGVDSLLNAILTQNACPKEIIVRDDRTTGLLADFCKKAGIAMTKAGRFDPLDALDEAMDAMIENLFPETAGPGRFDDDDDEDYDGDDYDENFAEMDEEEAALAMFDMIDHLEQLSTYDLKNMPPELKHFLGEIAAEGILPPEYQEKLERALKKM